MLGFGIREKTTTTGTGNLTLTAVAGYPRASQAFALNERFLYSILDANNQPIEHGIGYLSDANTLVRAAPMVTFSGGVYTQGSPAAVDLATGDKFVICSVVHNIPYMWPFENPGAPFHFVPGVITQDSMSTQTVTANRAYFIPFSVPRPMVVTAIGMKVTTATAGSAEIGIYAATVNGTKPGKLLGKVTALDTGTTGLKSGALSLPLFPGRTYYSAFWASANPAVQSVPSGARAHVMGWADTTTNQGSFYSADAQAGLADPAPDVNRQTTGAGTVPLVYLDISE